MNDVWDMLSEPFPPEELQWRVEELSKDKKRALVVPSVNVEAVLDRLDEVAGPHGWQDTYEVLHTPAHAGGLYAVKCRLTVMDVAKEDVGEGESLKAAFADALQRAAAKFGVGRYLLGQEQWVDHDPETGPTHPPQVQLGRAHKKVPPQAPTRPEASPTPLEAKPEPQELIDRLIERLREAGLGKQAAQIVMKYGGYGKHLDETRKLYGELRALLKG
ncbi:MAG: Rad52/Rad22 family DNA repair protein [Meiothermus sp.]|nr:Rad52/Rad22 family DNA repair protein [Meiothermus sp.]